MSVTHVTHHQQTEYSPTLWAVLLHQIPHVNITFHKLESEGFRPDSELYLEALGIIGSVPAAWLILTLIILLIYLLTRCCDTKNNKVNHIYCYYRFPPSSISSYCIFKDTIYANVQSTINSALYLIFLNTEAIS